MDRSMTRELTWAERVAKQHALEDADDWQYGVVWRFAYADDEQPVLGPPAGDRWEVNTDFGDAGQVVTVPRWSGGDVVQQLTHWRRKVPGMTNASPNRRVHERVKWDGDPRP